MWKGSSYGEGLFGLGGFTSPFIIRSSMGSGSTMAASANGRESRLLGAFFQIPTSLTGTPKPEKGSGVPELAQPVYPNKSKKHPTYNPRRTLTLWILYKPMDPILHLLL